MDAAHKFGHHGDLVEQFLVEIRDRRVDWADLAARAESPRQRPAAKAVADAPYPAALLSAVDKAALQAYGSLGLTRADFSDPLALGTVKAAIVAGAQGLAIHEKLAPEHLETLLRPFADVGFESADAVLGSLEHDTPGPESGAGEQ